MLELITAGVEEFVICPGARNVTWMQTLINSPALKLWWGFEERSAAFFALGRSRQTRRPVAVVTTSGTAVGELLPACMEAYYTSVPLVLLSADRPKRARYCGTPQTCIQPGIFGPYAPDSFDLEEGESYSLSQWKARSPLHINMCFEEPERRLIQTIPLVPPVFKMRPWIAPVQGLEPFLNESQRLLTVVSTLREEARAPVANFLKGLGGDLYIEGVSGLQDQFNSVELDLKNYTHVLRVGGVPTHSMWRRLEEIGSQEMGSQDIRNIKVLSLTEDPFSGLSWAPYCHCNLEALPRFDFNKPQIAPLKPREKGIIGELSKKMAPKSHIYLGNSLPIRIWDSQATTQSKGFYITASRGLNGIDGQISTFLGLCLPDRENWAILGDITTLYDLSAPWFMKALKNYDITIVVINNGGGRIFEKMFPIPEMINEHSLSFEPFAKLWGLHYEKWTKIPDEVSFKGARIVEIV